MISARALPILFIFAVIAALIVMRILRATKGPAMTQMADEQETGRGLLYGDLSLVNMMPLALGAEPPAEPWSHFQSVAWHLRAKDRVLALEDLHRIAADNTMTTQAQLLAWRCLRELGEQPDTQTASAVQAVVIEIPIRNNRDVQTVYRDGLIKCLTGFGKWTGRNAVGDPTIKKLTNDAQHVRPLLPLSPSRPPPTPIVPRVAVLTFGGIYVLDLDVSLVDTSSEPPYALYRTARDLAK